MRVSQDDCIDRTDPLLPEKRGQDQFSDIECFVEKTSPSTSIRFPPGKRTRIELPCPHRPQRGKDSPHDETGRDPDCVDDQKDHQEQGMSVQSQVRLRETLEVSCHASDHIHTHPQPGADRRLRSRGAGVQMNIEDHDRLANQSIKKALH